MGVSCMRFLGHNCVSGLRSLKPKNIFKNKKKPKIFFLKNLGFSRPAGMFPMIDINECDAADRGRCSFYATCVNTPGSYRCDCFDGLSGDGYNCHLLEPAGMTITPSSLSYMPRDAPIDFGQSVDFRLRNFHKRRDFF